MEVLDTIFAGPWGPIIIFLLRIVDVSLATIRMVLTVRGVKLAASLIAFFEVLIWIFAVGSAIRNLGSGWHMLGYAGGFAAGTFAGMTIEEKLALGMATVRILSRGTGVEIAEALRDRGFGATEFAGQGRDGRTEMIYTVVRRRQLSSVMEAIRDWDPDAFVTVEEPRAIQRGWLYPARRR